MLFKKKKKGPIMVRLDEDQFCTVIEEQSEDVSHKYCVIADESYYTLLYRDGRFMGMPCPFGGIIYPFAIDPKNQGSKRDKNTFRFAKIVCLSKDFNLKINWGTQTPFVIEDPITREAYQVGARGVFYLNIDPSDAAKKADMFYSKCLTQRNAELFNTEALRDFLRDAFIMQVGAKIQEYIEEKNVSIANYVGLQPSEMLKISAEICPKMSGIFGSYGLSIVKESSESSILQGLVVTKIEK